MINLLHYAICITCLFLEKTKPPLKPLQFYFYLGLFSPSNIRNNLKTGVGIVRLFKIQCKKDRRLKEKRLYLSLVGTLFVYGKGTFCHI